MTYNEALQILLERSHMSQADLAHAIGKSSSYVSQLMSGKVKEPSITLAFQISMALGTDIQTFWKLMAKDSPTQNSLSATDKDSRKPHTFPGDANLYKTSDLEQSVNVLNVGDARLNSIIHAYELLNEEGRGLLESNAEWLQCKFGNSEK